MKIYWDRVLDITESVLIILGFIFLNILVHELVHMIDGYSENTAICFGFFNWKRSAFVINGDNYTLFRGEPLAYLANVIIISIAVIIYRKKRRK